MRAAVLILFAALFSPTGAAAETVDLSQALREAVAARPFARASRLDAEAARAAVGETRSRTLPRATLSENFTWTDEPAGSLFISLNQEELELSQDAGAYNFPPSRKDFETRLTVQQTVFDPDLRYGVRRAETVAEAAEAAARRSAEEAAFAAFRAYLEVQQARAALAWVEGSRQEAAEILRLAEERRDAGVGLKADALRARVVLSEAERLALGAANDLAIARRRLAQAIGRSAGEVEIAAPLDPAQLAAAGEGPVQRGDLEAIDLQAREAALAHDQSRAEWLPRLGVDASYALHDGSAPFGTEAASWAVRAGLSWEFFDGFRRRHSSARTAAAARAAGERAREAHRQVLLAREEARRRGEEARLQLGAAREAEAAAVESRRLTRERFEAGLSPLSDLLTAQASLDRVRFDVVLAESRYLFALGNGHFQQGTFLQALLSDAKEDLP